LVSHAGDQAEGLRQILAFSRARTIAVVAGTRGAGATTCVLNIACALAAACKRVLVVDENDGGNVAQAFGLAAGGDLEQVVEGACELEDVLLQGPADVTILPAARAARALPLLDAVARQRAVNCFGKLDRAADIVLVDASHDVHEPSAFARAAQEVVVVVSPGPSSVTGGYAAIKRMTQAHGRSRFRLLVNRASDLDTAAHIHHNMAHVATKHLNTEIEFMGAVPQDAMVTDCAQRNASVVELAPACPASRTFLEHAASIARWAAPGDQASRLDSFMERAIHGSRRGLCGAGA
jgi:flagellar biosynthesis protein FlhG